MSWWWAAATSIADEPGTIVTLSYRAEAFSRATEQNRRRIETAQAAGRLRVMMQSDVSEITETGVVLAQGGNRIELPNNAVIVCAGGILPTPFLKAIGIEMETKFGTA